ncbi:MAG TPA: hypothetical protein VIX59_19525 [Candidatus Binataceae bacterium]
MDEKLSLILGQMRSVRARINSLAWQHIVFRSLAITIAAGAVVFASAYLLAPLGFLVSTLIVAFAAGAGLVRAIHSGWILRASALRAAEVADQRAELRGRLSTVTAMARNPHPGPLWPYLVEDTLARRGEFVPAKIERRRISRSVFALCGALLLALAAYPLTKLKHAPQASANNLQNDLTVDLNDLHLRPADSDDTGLEVSADPVTMRRLQDKLAREGIDASGNATSPLVNLVAQARNLAGHVQNKLTGGASAKSRLTLHLADAGEDANRNQVRGPDQPRDPSGPRDEAGQFKQEQHVAGGDEPLPPIDNSPQQRAAQPTPGATPDSGNEFAAGKDSSSADSDTASDLADQGNGDRGSNGGPSHGVGTDPDSLFGSAINSKLGNEGFEIAIEARPMDKGTKGAGHAYIPPKVRTPLNPSQAPDEPVSRAAVPAEDRTTIKRVFER